MDMISKSLVVSKSLGLDLLSSALSISFSLKNAGMGFFVFGRMIFNVGSCVASPRTSRNFQKDLRVDILRERLRAEILVDISSNVHC